MPSLAHRLVAIAALAAGVTATTVVACERCRPAPTTVHRIQPTAAAPATASTRTTTSAETTSLLRTLDERSAAVSSARPHLVFPVRIGIARLEDGRVTPIPPAEWAIWRETHTRLGPQVIEFSPISALVPQSITTDALSRTPHDAITHLRLGAARQQLDALIVYELGLDTSMQRTELTFLDATIIGAWAFPTHRSHATAHASATILDVRSGLAYGSALGTAADKRSSTLLGSEERRYRQREHVARKAVALLAPEVADRLLDLAANPREAQAAFVPIAPVSALSPRHTQPASPSSEVAIALPARNNAPNNDRDSPPPVERSDSFWDPR